MGDGKEGGGALLGRDKAAGVRDQDQFQAGMEGLEREHLDEARAETGASLWLFMLTLS